MLPQKQLQTIIMLGIIAHINQAEQSPDLASMFSNLRPAKVLLFFANTNNITTISPPNCEPIYYILLHRRERILAKNLLECKTSITNVSIMHEFI